jgi:predicted DNA binding protein
MTISFDDFFRSLTRRQFSALVSAIEMGYYSMPKKVTMNVIASKLGVPRSTFEEHLRKAEIKMMQSLRPYTRLGSYSRDMRIGKKSVK